MYELDYDGDMKYYQDQLAKKGITKDMLNMDNYAGLTARELQSIVDSVQLVAKVSNELEHGATSGTIIDLNGNKVGSWKR